MGRAFRVAMPSHPTLSSISAIRTLIQITASGTRPFKLLRCHGAFNSVTPTKQAVQVLRKTATVTGGNAFTPLKLNPLDAAFGGTALVLGASDITVEGTDGDVLWHDLVDYLYGWSWKPEKEVIVEATGILAVKLPIAPGGAVGVYAEMLIEELP